MLIVASILEWTAGVYRLSAETNYTRRLSADYNLRCSRMNKKLAGNRFFRPRGNQGGTVEEWHNGADMEIHFYGRALRKAVSLLIERLQATNQTQDDWDVGPVVLLYRQAVELQLKAVIGEGGGFLKAPTDHLTLVKTRSLRWLAQITSQIIKAVQWEAEFKCKGVSNLADFNAVIAELEGMEPVSAAIYAEPRKKNLGEVPQQLFKTKVLQIASKMH